MLSVMVTTTRKTSMRMAIQTTATTTTMNGVEMAALHDANEDDDNSNDDHDNDNDDVGKGGWRHLQVSKSPRRRVDGAPSPTARMLTPG